LPIVKSAANLQRDLSSELQCPFGPAPDRTARPSLSRRGSTVFAVFAGNYQRRTAPPPQESSAAGGVANEEQWDNISSLRGLVCSLRKVQRSYGALVTRQRKSAQEYCQISINSKPSQSVNATDPTIRPGLAPPTSRPRDHQKSRAVRRVISCARTPFGRHRPRSLRECLYPRMPVPRRRNRHAFLAEPVTAVSFSGRPTLALVERFRCYQDSRHWFPLRCPLRL
jgi:hypothetical protein